MEQFFKKFKRFKPLVFDKTGTITIGQPLVTDVVGDEARVLTLAASLETFQNIPSASGFITSRRKGLVLSPVENFQAIEGKGSKVRSTSSW